MHEIPIIADLLIIFGLAIPVIFLCHRLNIPSLVGLLITGIMIGPNALVVIESQAQVEVLAEIGIILLLFVIGLEFSLEKLSRIKTVVLAGGSIQVLSAIGLGTVLAYSLGVVGPQAIFAGFLIALSSTAIVLKMMQDRGEIDTPEGQNMLGILIYQDVAIVPLMLLTPFLAGAGEKLMRELGVLVASAGFMILLVIVLARYVIPPVLHWITSTRQRDLFLLSIVFMGLAICWISFRLGLSLSLGAFLAGLVISESEYSHEAIAHVIPFRDVFTSLFFVSMGILLDPGIFLEMPLVILGLTIAVMGIGTLTAGLAILLLGYPLGVVTSVAVGLNQVGEFSLILSKVGLDYELITLGNYQLFLAVAVLSMMITPFEYRIVSRWTKKMPDVDLYSWLGWGSPVPVDRTASVSEPNDHLIVVGYGPTGRHLVQALETYDVPYVISEMNPTTVHAQQNEGRPIYYGDAGQEAVLERLGVHRARALVVTMSDPAAARQIVQRARSMNPDLHIVSRTRYIDEMKPLYELGADEVVPEELETSLAIFVRVLRKYMVPDEEIRGTVQGLRSDYYEELVVPDSGQDGIAGNSSALSSFNTSRIEVPEGEQISGETLADLDLRNEFDVTVVAVERGEETTLSPASDFRPRSGDVLVVMGEPEHVRKFRDFLGNDG